MGRCKGVRRMPFLKCQVDGAECHPQNGGDCYKAAEATESSTLSDQVVSDGVWFRSAMSGELYRERTKAGDIDCVYVDGVPFGKLG